MGTTTTVAVKVVTVERAIMAEIVRENWQAERTNINTLAIETKETFLSRELMIIFYLDRFLVAPCLILLTQRFRFDLAPILVFSHHFISSSNLEEFLFAVICAQKLNANRKLFCIQTAGQ